jgi:thiol:disulfide interchange protein DsbD
MFDVFQMRTPKVLSGGALGSIKGGSFLSAFIFGAASGTVASPCLSPGLIMLLSLVTSLGNPYLGFILLFSFGIGLSIPLLIIGTFSSSLSMLPQAGMWMVEIKHFFGLLLFGMCLYFLKTIVPAAVISWLSVSLAAASGLYYLYSARTTFSPTIRFIKNLLGIALLAFSVHLFFKAYQSVTTPSVPAPSFWESHYETALARAHADNKKLFINIGAPFCSICHALDDTLFKDETVLEILAQCIPLKVDGSEPNHPVCCNKEYNVIGFPTILVVDPKTCSVVKRWGAELYDTHPTSFIEDLKACLVP